MSSSNKIVSINEPLIEDKTYTSSLSSDQKTQVLWNNICLEQSTVPFSGESSFLVRLWVSVSDESHEEFHQSASAQSVATGFELTRVKISTHHLELTYSIKAALKLLIFREQHVLVQFWSPRVVGNHQLLTTIDQPFGLSVVAENLCIYRKESEKNSYLVDTHHEEDDHYSPPARVFKRGLPEWTSDITNYKPNDFPQLKSAISSNLHGYLALPVFDNDTGSCLGVLELLMSSRYTSYIFEVQQVHNALKRLNLTSPQVLDRPASKVPNERSRNECNIFSIIKEVSDIHNIPLAQTWAMSPTSSYVSYKNVIEKSCSSFDIRCIGKECMYTTSLPFHVRNLDMWQFREACRVQHLDKSRGFVGQALLAHGSGYCENVTELTEDEYPLVHYARMSGLATCFTIFLRTIEGDDDYQDYVLEFFLKLGNKDSRYVMSLVQTLKQKVDGVFGFELGEISSIEIIGLPRDADHFSSIINPHIIKISSSTITFNKGSSDSESFLADVSQTKLNDNSNVGKMNHALKQGRKCKIKSLTMKSLEQHIEKPIGQAAESLGVSRSTLKRFCREQGISSWPVSKRRKKASCVTEPKMSRIGDSTLCTSTGKSERATNIVNDCSNVEQKLSDCSLVDASLKQSVRNVCEIGMVMVKVTFNNDMLKFRFPVSSGLLELKNEVARRVNVNDKRLSMRYKDEDKDLVSITCDADLHALPEFLVGNSTIRLHAQLVDD